jgi:molybdate transport system substrate-binding protein
MTFHGVRMKSSALTAVLVTALTLAHASVASAERITVLCSNGFKAVLQEVAPQFEKTSGHQLAISYSVSAELKRRIESGEAFDLVVITPAQIDDLIKTGRVVSQTRAPLARAGMALAVRRGAPKPDVRTVDALKATLVASKSIAFAKEGTGGVFLMSLLKRFGLVEQMTPKFKATTTGDEVSQAVARGEAELGVLPLSEILPVPGVEVAGSFPAEVQDYAVMVGGVGAAAAHSAAARSLLEFLSSPALLPVVEKKGMERPPR